MAKKAAATVAAETAKTVTVEALEWHTYQGNAYDVGDTYELDENLVDSLKTQGKAVPVDRVARARSARSASAKPAKAARTRASKKK